MALPPAPTITTILTEAYKRTGLFAPTAADLQRAEDEWLEEVKRDIAGRTRWRILQGVAVVIPTARVGVYAIPMPLLGVSEIWFYDGETKGTAQAGTANTLTLASSTTTDSAKIIGYKIFLTGGLGGGQSNRVTAYNPSTKVATMESNWTTTPDSTTTYMIANTTERLLDGPNPHVSRAGFRQSNRPMQWEEWNNQILLDPIPDLSTYGMEWRGPIDVSLIDETDPKYTRLLREWRTALLYGVMVKKLEQDDDVQGVQLYMGRYEAEIQRLMIQDRHRMRREIGSRAKGFGGMPLPRRI